MDEPAGTEYVWFNNVETARTRVSAPLRGPEDLAGAGSRAKQATQAQGRGRVNKLLGIFASPVQPELKDYHEPWTYDYRTLVEAPLGDDFPVARPKSSSRARTPRSPGRRTGTSRTQGAGEMGTDPIVQTVNEKVRREIGGQVRSSSG